MTKNARGKLFVSKVDAEAAIAFSGAKQPSAAELDELHHDAHEECYIANSVLTEVVVEPLRHPAPRRGPDDMRYLPHTDADRRAMLAKIGVADIDALFADIPTDKRLDGLVDLPKAKGEMEVERVLGKLAAQNIAAGSVPFFVGAGAYKHHVPASVDHLIQRSEFLTSYTPYQPEIAQGTLQYLFEFQTQVAMLTGHGGGQRLHVRRLDGDRRGRADGAPHHQAAQGGALRRPASALSRDHRDGVAPGRA